MASGRSWRTLLHELALDATREGLQLLPKQPRVPVGGHRVLGDSTPSLLY